MTHLSEAAIEAAARRTPHDGKPYYCETCGLGYAEFMACEEGCCSLESEAEAIMRRAAYAVDLKEGEKG